MKLDMDFSQLEKLVRHMGATPVIWVSNVSTIIGKTNFGEIDLEKLQTIGIEIDITDVNFSSDGFARDPINGEQILLHIKEVNSFYGSLPKYHFSQCRTLIDMDNKGKIEKYVMTQRKDGYFFIDKNGIQNCEEKLVVCKNCLNWYNKQYRRGLTVESFDIADFFRHFKKTPITKKPTHTDIFAPKSGYTDDWDSISLRLKQQSGYICDDCRINLINHKKLVQTHHINGQKNDNRNSNLKVLCMECHSEQPDHGHMKRSAAHEILEVRRIKAQDPHFRVNRNAFR